MANFKKKHQPKKNHGCSICNRSLDVRNEVRSQRRKAHVLLENIIDMMDDDVELQIKEIKHNVNKYG